MHMRRKKWARPELAVCPYFRDTPVHERGKWREAFKKDQPLFLELGCGKGVSTAQMAFENPDTNFVAVDITCDILGDARRNIEKVYDGTEPANILLARFDIEYIDQYFSKADRVERIYIHFCNPWTKRPKYAKRRLTHPRQLLKYREFLTPGAEIWFKTDNDELFEDSLTYFEVSGYDRLWMTRDLHAEHFSPNYLSEHEKKYSEMGVPIKMGIFRMTDRKVEIDPLRWGLPRKKEETDESADQE